MSAVAAPLPAAAASSGPSRAAAHRLTSRQHLYEGLAIFAVFAIAFGLLGYWTVVDMRVVTFSSLDRLTGAWLVWHGVPPKVAAVGFSLPPLQTLMLLPFTVIASMATSLVALPVCSAIFGGLSMVAINRMLERCDMTAGYRYPVLILIALTPTVAFYAASGGAEVISLFMQTAAISSLIAWYRTVDTRYLISSAIAFAFAAMSDYSSIVLMALAVIMVATVLSRHGADEAEVESSIITYLMPTVYALALWCFVAWLIIDAPFSWITAGSGTSVNVVHSVAHSAGVATVFGDCLRLCLATAPLTFVVTPALMISAIAQRNEMAGWLAGFSVITIFRPGVDALIHHNVADIQMSLSLPILLMAVVGAAWLYQSTPSARSVIGIGLIVGLLASIALVWHGMDSYPYQNMEQAFKTAVSSGGSTKPTHSRGGLEVGIKQEQNMAFWIGNHVNKPRSILTDNSQTYAVMLISGRPILFGTRLLYGDGLWKEKVVKPPHSVKYFLITKGDRGDYINDKYLGAVKGRRHGLRVVHQNKRYALLSVAPGTTVKNSLTRGNSLPPSNGPIPINSL